MAAYEKYGNYGWSSGGVGWRVKQRTIIYPQEKYIDVVVECYIDSNCRIDYNSLTGWVSMDGRPYEYAKSIAYSHPYGGSHAALITSHEYRVWRGYKQKIVNFQAKVQLPGELAGTSYSTDDIWVDPIPVSEPSISSVSLSSSRSVQLQLNIRSSDADVMVIERQNTGTNSSTVVYQSSPTSQFSDNLPGAGTYRYRAKNMVDDISSEWSDWSRTVTAVAVPSSPIMRNVERVDSTKIKITLDVNSTNATSMSIFRQKSGSSSEVEVYKGNPVSTYTDTPGQGTYRYRAKNYTSAGGSGYSEYSSWVSMLKAPAAPTIIEPASSSIVTSDKPLIIKWRHNPEDGTAQTKAVIRIRGPKIQTQRIYNINGSKDSEDCKYVEPNQDLEVQVKTKGAHPDESPWSDVRRFKYLAPISASIKPIGSVRKFPIPVTWSYEDGYGHQSWIKLEIYKGPLLVYTGYLYNTQTTKTLYKGDFNLENNTEYTAKLEVYSSSGLHATSTRTFRTDLAAPGKPSAEINAYSTNGTVSIKPKATSGEILTDYFNIKRGGKTIASKVKNGYSVTDTTAPVDTVITYTIEAVGETGVATTSEYTTIINSNGFAFINYRDGFTDVAKLAMDLKLTEKVDSEKTMLVTPSRKLPVVVYGDTETITGSLSAKTWWLEDMSKEGQEAMCQQFEELARYKGICLLRLPHRENKYVVLNVTINKGDRFNLAGISIDYQEVDAYGLD